MMMRSYAAAVALFSVVACRDMQPAARETAAARESAAAVGAAPTLAPAPAQQSSPRSAEEDSVIARARVVLAAVRPSFREWSAEMFAPVQLDSAAPAARMAPLVGDFDGDGAPDVAFEGSDSTGAVIQAVLSHKGQPIVALVTREKELAVGVDLHRSRLALAHDELGGKPLQGIDVVVWDEKGREVALSARLVYQNGRFAVLVSGQ